MTLKQPVTMSSASSTSFAPNASASSRGRKGVARSLFIGVGAWGTQILSELRRELDGTHGSLSNLPTLAWLSLNWGNDQWASWNDDERIAFNTDHAQGGDWRRESAGANRGQARTGFWNVWRQIEHALRSKVGSVLLAESGLQSAKYFGFTDDSLLNIYLVADLGQSPTGAVFDLAYALRFLLRNGLSGPTQTARLIGVLGLPDAVAAPETLANAYAALRELNHWNDAHTSWSAQGPNEARFSAPMGEVPLDFATLWTPRNASGHALDGADLMSAVTQWLALDLHPNLAPARNDDRSRLSSISRAVDDWNQPINYFAAGVAALEFPREALCQAVAARLAREAWEGALTAHALPTTLAAMGNDEVQRFARDFDYDAVLLLEELEATPEAPRLLRIGDLIEQHRAEWQGNISLLSEAAPDAAIILADDIYCELSQDLVPRGAKTQRLLATPIDSVTEGKTAALLRERFAGLQTKWQIAANNFIIKKAGDPQWRGEGAEALIQMLADLSANASAILETAKVQLLTETEATWTQFEATWREFTEQELRKHSGFLGRGARKHQTNLAQKFAERGASVGALTLKRQALEALCATFEAAPNVWTRPRADLKRFCNAVQEGSRALRGRGESWENAPPITGQLVLHASNPDSLRAAAKLYSLEMNGQFEAGQSPQSPGETLNLWRDIEYQLGDKIFVSLMTGQGPNLVDSLWGAALERARTYFAKTAALDLFAALYPDENAAGARAQQLFRAADAFFPLTRGTVVPGWNEGSLRQLRRAGFHNADIELRRSDAENHFYAVTKSLGFSDQQAAPDENLGLADTARALFWSEVGGFPLRCGGGYLRDLENAYLAHGRSFGTASLHSRADIAFWLPIEAPAPEVQQSLWRDFLVALACDGASFSPMGDGKSGEFSLSGADGILALGQGPSLVSAEADSLAPWREVVFRCAAEDARKRLKDHLNAVQSWPVRDVIGKLAAFLGRIESVTLRHHVSDVLSGWKEQTLGDQERKLAELLSKIEKVLENPTLSHLHAHARQKQSEFQRDLALLQGQTNLGGDTLSAAQELERLLST